jgi:hypothetical protein
LCSRAGTGWTEIIRPPVYKVKATGRKRAGRARTPDCTTVSARPAQTERKKEDETMNEQKLFKCAHCGGEFQKEWSDEERAAEKDNLFPDVPVEECVVVCDDCFKLLMGGVQ